MFKRRFVWILFAAMFGISLIAFGISFYTASWIVQKTKDCTFLSAKFQKSIQKDISVGGLGGSIQQRFVASCESPKYQTCVGIYERTEQYDTLDVSYDIFTIDLRTQHELNKTHSSNVYQPDIPIDMERFRSGAKANACGSTTSTFSS